MDRSSVCYLIAKEGNGTDEIGQETVLERERRVFCDVESVSGTETFEAGRSNISPVCKILIFSPEYKGEKVVILDGVRYSVYRTYLNKRYDTTELYLSKKAGEI